MKQLKDKNVLFFDIETALMEVYTHYIGQKVSIQYNQVKTPKKIICIGYSWLNENKAYSLQWDKNQDETKMLDEFASLVECADILVGHNINSFDIKELRTRMLHLGLEPFPETPTIDTLTDLRRSFKFVSNRLDYLSREFAGGGKAKMCMQDWIDVNNGCTKALNKMVKYCKKDVIENKKVFKEVYPHIVLNPKLASTYKLNTVEIEACTHCESFNIVKYGFYNYKGNTFQKYMCKDCFKISKA